jgi:hypothetical protein
VIGIACKGRAEVAEPVVAPHPFHVMEECGAMMGLRDQT